MLLTRFSAFGALVLAMLNVSCGDGGTSIPRVPASEPSPQASPNDTGGSILNPVRQGIWGSEQIEVLVGETSTRVEFGCALGTIPGRLQTNSAGQFTAEGTISIGGPIIDPNPQNPRPAQYSGLVQGNQMTLNVIYRSGATQVSESYSATFGVQGQLIRCL